MAQQARGPDPMELGEHAGFIITAYLTSFFVIGGAVVWSLTQGRRIQARIDELEARGIRRRSDKKAAPVAGVSDQAKVADQGSKA